MRASTTVDRRELDGARWVCLTERLASASAGVYVVIVDKGGGAAGRVFLFWKERREGSEHGELWVGLDPAVFLLHAASLQPVSTMPSAAHVCTYEDSAAHMHSSLF